jgi:preprotein translocase subunit YajC
MGGFGFLLIIIAFVFLYFVLVRPQKKRQLQQQRLLDDLKVGDEIVTAGGLYGEVRELHDEQVLVRIAPDLDVRVARRAVAGITTPHAPDELEAPEEPDLTQTGPTPGT